MIEGFMLFKRKKAESKAGQTYVKQEPAGTQEPTYIGKDARLQGNVYSDGEIHIDGTIEGSVQSHTCLVDLNGEVRGSLSAQYVVVRGRVLGPITATQVTIQKGAHVEGDVMHEGLSIEHGAFVMGSITQSSMSGSGEINGSRGNQFHSSLFGQAPAQAEAEFEEQDSKILKLNKPR
jgi:cytoskeletal protein CcmA (bactofilin family)